jgi:predicted ArsR family transcriptional regulator
MSAVATKSSKSTKTRAASDRGQVQRIILALKAQGKQTAKECGVTPVIANYVARQGLIKSIKTVKNTDADGNALRGRPAHVYVLTDKGRKLATKLLKAQAAA